MRIFILLILSLTSCYSVAAKDKVAIIIDDIGYRKTDVNILNLPSNITFSILPHTPYGKSLAEQGFMNKHEIMLHIPMQAENGKLLGPGGLTNDMNESMIRTSLKEAFAEIPFAIGINNHMGSLLTALRQPMSWVMKFIKEQNVIFIDSATSSNSKAGAIAKQLGIPTLQRDVFLDNNLEYHYIAKQFSLLIKQAKKHGIAIAIAHPHPESIDSINKLLPQLARQNIELVAISQLFNIQQVEKSKQLTD
ncbi:divergent polysaccharide deacetylase family protein [Colwellia sp. RE-S-Sl-9]